MEAENLSYLKARQKYLDGGKKKMPRQLIVGVIALCVIVSTVIVLSLKFFGVL
jgi:hypothetical protein